MGERNGKGKEYFYYDKLKFKGKYLNVKESNEKSKEMEKEKNILMVD